MKAIYLFYTLLACSFFIACGNKAQESSETVQQEEPVEEIWKDCEYCNGRGYFTHQCSTCDGEGRLQGKFTQTSTRSCPSCYGTGITPCHTCNNQGSFDCQNCTGGEVVCTACGGAGQRPLSYGSSVTFVDCGYCGGDGYISCPKCYGKGRI